MSLLLGSRGSPLALAQSHLVAAMLVRSTGKNADAFPVETFMTSGDRIQDKSLADSGGKGLFTKEIEDALREGHIDMAVHSMKDVPIARQPGLYLPLPRGAAAAPRTPGPTVCV